MQKVYESLTKEGSRSPWSSQIATNVLSSNQSYQQNNRLRRTFKWIMGEMVYMVSYTGFQGEKGCRALGLARNLRFNLKYYIQISKIQKSWHGQTVTMLWWLLAPLQLCLVMQMWNSGDLIFVVKWVKLVSQNGWGGLCLESWGGFSRSGKLYKQQTKDIRSVVVQ